VTARLRSQGLCTRVEAERLMSFTNNSSPLFMLAAVAVGMFNNPGLGAVIAGAHYLSSLTLGFALRFYGRRDPERFPAPPAGNGNPVLLALRRMLEVQRQDGRPPGKIMGDAVRSAVTNLLNIGGFIILFAVIIRLLTAAGFIDALAGVLGVFLLPLGFSPEILPALGSGLFEMTIGAKMASEAAAPLIQQVVAVGMILAWSGLSVQAQAAAMVAGTDIRMAPFIVSRLIHAGLAGLYTYIFCGWAGVLAEPAAPAAAAAGAGQWQNAGLVFFSARLFGIFLLALAAAVSLAVLLHLAARIRPPLFKGR
ncbi:MAG: sporulation integral membrane protein YlbJ, partial [Peptococcaceae bacterium]|nr:sporulation integral membrane protein YlbJ [Peptococcaceae bacterium]